MLVSQGMSSGVGNHGNGCEWSVGGGGELWGLNELLSHRDVLLDKQQAVQTPLYSHLLNTPLSGDGNIVLYRRVRFKTNGEFI